MALGHYHVRHRVAPRAWYAGALEYVSSNLWGELADEARLGVSGKGWLLVDLDSGAVESRPVAAARRVLDLEPIRAEGMDAAALDAAIAARLASVPGGIAEQILRLRVYDVPRHVARSLDHAAIRALEGRGAASQPRSSPSRGASPGRAWARPGRRQTLPELVRNYLERRPLPAELDRARFVRTGGELMDAVERDATAAG